MPDYPGFIDYGFVFVVIIFWVKAAFKTDLSNSSFTFKKYNTFKQSKNSVFLPFLM